MYALYALTATLITRAVVKVFTASEGLPGTRLVRVFRDAPGPLPSSSRTGSSWTVGSGRYASGSGPSPFSRGFASRLGGVRMKSTPASGPFCRSHSWPFSWSGPEAISGLRRRGSTSFVVHLAGGLLFGPFWGGLVAAVSTALSQIYEQKPLLKGAVQHRSTCRLRRRRVALGWAFSGASLPLFGLGC